MTNFNRTKTFKKDWQRQKAGGKTNLTKATELMHILATSGVIPPQFIDHPLHQWDGCRCAHFGGDYVIVYRRTNEGIVFERIGSHNDIF